MEDYNHITTLYDLMRKWLKLTAMEVHPHFHSSTTSGSACFMRSRTRASVSPLRGWKPEPSQREYCVFSPAGYEIVRLDVERWGYAIRAMAVKIENQLDEAHRIKWRMIARLRCQTVDRVIQGLADERLDEIDATAELESEQNKLSSATTVAVKFNSLAGAGLVEWSDDRGPDPILHWLQWETIGIAE